MPNAGNERSRKWCFTLNNPVENDEAIIAAAVDSKLLSYAIFGREVGESGTPHLQGYLEFSSKTRLNSARALLPRAHWEKSRARNSTDAIRYCKKDGDWIEKGKPLAPGRRSDLELIRLRIDEGASDLDVAQEYFSQWCQYRRSFAEYRRLVSGSRAWKSRVQVLWGLTGVGKTRIVHALYRPDEIWTYGGGGWFDGYRGQRVALFDDFRGEDDGLPWDSFCDSWIGTPWQFPSRVDSPTGDLDPFLSRRTWSPETGFLY